MSTAPKSTAAGGRFFEDFRIGETIRHATPRTLGDGDAALYSALYGARFAPQSAETDAQGPVVADGADDGGRKGVAERVDAEEIDGNGSSPHRSLH